MSSISPSPSPLPRLVMFIACLAIAGTALAGIVFLTTGPGQETPVRPQNTDECWRLTSYAQVQKEYCEKNVASMQGGCDVLKKSKDEMCRMSNDCTEQWRRYETYGGWVAQKPTCNREGLQQECARLPGEIGRCTDSAAAHLSLCKDEYRKNLASAEDACRPA
jgi:hypothetical protein